MALFPFRPNWDTSVTVTVEYRTDIITSRSGKERQRRALRAQPRVSLGFATVFPRDRQRAFERFLTRRQSALNTLGDPTRRVDVVDPTAAGATEVRVTMAAPMWLVDGIDVVVEHGDYQGQFTVLSVAVVDTDHRIVTLDNPVPVALWPGAALRPAMPGYVGETTGQTHVTDSVSTASIDFSVDPGFYSDTVPGPGVFLHNGREVFFRQPNWSTSPTSSWDWKREVVDFGYGRVDTYAPASFGTRTRQATFLNRSTAEAYQLLGLFNRMRGQQGEFYWATGTNDMTVFGDRATGSTALVVVGREVFDDYADDTVYRAVMVRLNDDRIIFRSVADMSVNGAGNTLITMTEPWLCDINAADVAIVSWLPVCRFATDILTSEWITDSVTQMQTSVNTLEDLAVDDPVSVDGATQAALEIWGLPASLMLFDQWQWLVNWPTTDAQVHANGWTEEQARVAFDEFDLLVNSGAG